MEQNYKGHEIAYIESAAQWEAILDEFQNLRAPQLGDLKAKIDERMKKATKTNVQPLTVLDFGDLRFLTFGSFQENKITSRTHSTAWRASSVKFDMKTLTQSEKRGSSEHQFRGYQGTESTAMLRIRDESKLAELKALTQQMADLHKRRLEVIASMPPVTAEMLDAFEVI